ncbi:hypothetical protein [Nocardioides litoris]|uniref:hypothetical protein n=1 Tax=Nocardioides litoris TaxID=1926648 RepID=UPI00111D1414|nr:hypothetical protein [Nocardioides litoris]
MSNPFTSGAEMATTALLTGYVGAATFPAAWPLVSEIFFLQGDPGAMYDAGMAWMDAAEAIADAIHEATDIQAAVAATGWEGTDADAFHERVGEYVTQLTADMLICTTTGVSMIVMATLIFVAVVFVFALSAILAGLAVAYWAMLAGVVSAPAAAAFWANVQAWCLSILAPVKSMSTAITVTGQGCAAAIGAMLVANLGTQTLTGNPEAWLDAGKATIDSTSTIAAGLGSWAINYGLGKGIKYEFMPFTYVGVGTAGAGGLDEDLGGLNPVGWPENLTPEANRDGLPDEYE